MKIQLLMTGSELMSGDIIDSNSAMIAQQLKNIGLEIKRKVTLADDYSLLVDEINFITSQSDVLIINGGLGPTTDDLTAQALADVAKVELVQHDDAYAHVIAWCEKRGAAVNQPNLKQTILPQGCDIIANRVGSAVGIQYVINDCLVLCTPGVPRELSVMIDDEIVPMLFKQLPASLHAHTTRFQVFGYGESGLQKLLAEQFPDWPESLEIGFRAGMPLLELKVTSRTQEDKQLKAVWLEKITALLNDHIVSEVAGKPLSIASTLLSLLTSHNKTLTTAESCTGGLIASLLTKEAGASTAFHAGFVTYDNEIKTSVLKVKPDTLKQYGAVSEQTVIEMANGALNASKSDYVIAVTGIAGPDGGTAEKPVGTVWVAWGEKGDILTQCLSIKTSRAQFQHLVAAIGLDLIRRKILNIASTPRYFIERKAK